MNINKVIIAGSRTINDYNLIESVIHDSGFQIDEVVCGCAKGVDNLGKMWAELNNVPIIEFPADWHNLNKQPCKIKIDKVGRKYNVLAGFNRNLEMAQYATHLIIIHNNSGGSLSMKGLAKQYKLQIYERVIG